MKLKAWLMTSIDKDCRLGPFLCIVGREHTLIGATSCSSAWHYTHMHSSLVIISTSVFTYFIRRRETYGSRVRNQLKCDATHSHRGTLSTSILTTSWLQLVLKALVHYECFRERPFVSASTKEANNHTQGTHLML